MKVVLLLKHIESKTVLTMYFKNVKKAIKWWTHFPFSEEWVFIHEGEREKSGHRYELTYSTFNECGKLYSRYVICYSKKESLILRKKIEEVNPNYIFNIKKLY